ncbi:MAG: tRNA pseudouridine(55) synthase TruB [Candidatus Contendobacter odensis]|uniref:tRNA pseudouridine synthase B n=1 Tax=Candidatus Contendibacter odensensis TaxID=1400860 RepID=A0A2G6PG18_9GAMM|nr:MAG: tRNA pseudouridine(55) synthase TruB [Candidatus Contendobacter odensis]
MRSRRGRPVNGLLLLDKPVGLTSNAALQTVKRIYQAAKAGHTGSLDPLASGLLPICLGEATKLSGFLLNADKSYRFTCCLGVKTTTGDAEGEVLMSRPVGAVGREQVERALQQFTGVIQQIPPMHSAIKRNGQPLYKLAREGIEVEREPRQITIYELRLLHLEGNRMECEMRCSKGTYVRTLAMALGDVLGCGAHISALRRTAVAPFDAGQMETLESLRERAGQEGLAALDSVLLPLDSAVAHWPAVRVKSDMAFYLRQGQPIMVPHAPTQGWVRLYQNEQQFLGLGEILDDGRVAPRRLLA